MIESLIKDSDVNRGINARQDTALHFAVYNNDVNTVKLLLENGADCNVENSRGQTPKKLAEDYKKEQIIDLFKQ